jgi:hypothetical protein
MLGARVCEIPEGQEDSPDVQKLFVVAPQFNLGDAHAFVIAELLAGWRTAGLSSEIGMSDASQWLCLEAVKEFFPLTAAEVESLHERAQAGAIVLEAPKFERLWRDWVVEQTHDLTQRSAARFVRVLGLGEWLPEVLLALDRITGVDAGTSAQRGNLVGVFLDNSKKILKSDTARSTEGTCAHAIVCATLWASFYCDRSIPSVESDLRRQLDLRVERYRERQYGDAKYLTSELQLEFEALSQEAAGAFNALLTPTALGIYLRFSVAIQFGPAADPSHMVSAILRLEVLDGGSAAAMCAYLVALKLKPQFIHQISMAIERGKYPAVDAESAANSLGLAPLQALRQAAAAPMLDSDGDGLDADLPNDQSVVNDPVETDLAGEAPDDHPDVKT